MTGFHLHRNAVNTAILASPMLGLSGADTERQTEILRVDIYVFYFDVVGLVDEFLSHREDALTRLREFQRRARSKFEFDHEHSYVVTLYDNVWARVNANEQGLPSLLLDFAGHVMHAAQAEGFGKFFGAITRGLHAFDPDDRMLVGGNSFEDLREQHLDATSEPHIRAALAEKWCRTLRFPINCVWVSADAVDPQLLPAQCCFPGSAFRPFGDEFDLAGTALRDGHTWPFASSRFRAVRAASIGDQA